MKYNEAKKISDEIIEMYTHYGGEEYAGEKVTQLEHMVQAAQLARAQGYDDEVVLAAFLHDIGHIAESANGENEMDGFGIRDHESLGASYLEKKGFSNRLTRLVGSHVAAKRYLTLRDQSYYEQLSEASKRTLTYQGGPMSDQEADIMEADPLFREIIQMRKWDEAAKIEHQPVPALDNFGQLILEHLLKQPE
jgi:phosphonate degradation associated HDIG domain protein